MTIDQAYAFVFTKSGKAELSRDDHNQLLIALDMIKKELDKLKT